MATEAENIRTALDNVARQLAEMTVDPKPSYSENGRSVSWGEHFNNLMTAQEKLLLALRKAEGPFTIFT